DNDRYYVVIGSGKDDDGKALLYKSDDLLKWNYVGVLAESNGKLGTIWECPDFFKIDDKYVLMISPMGLDNRKTVYLVGHMDYTTGKFTWEESGEIDWGFDYYAPQSLEDDKGRRIIIGWQNSWPWMNWFKGFGPTNDYDYNGCMSIAREVKISEDNKLRFIPVEEMKSLRGEFVSYENIDIKESELDLSKNNNIHFEIEANIDLNKTTSKEFSFELRSLNDKKTVITFDLENKKLIFDRNASDGYNEGVRSCDIELNRDILDIRIFSDTSSIEVYTNDYKTVMTSNIYMVDGDFKTKIVSKDGELYINKITKFNLDKSEGEI
ncbi:MAG: glycoside hydrolase family 32 protein, partial [Peptostreptococcaceae bacterium]